MDDRDPKQQTDSTIMIVERRSQKERELSSSEIMRIVRRRSALRMRKPGGSGSGGDNKQ